MDIQSFSHCMSSDEVSVNYRRLECFVCKINFVSQILCYFIFVAHACLLTKIQHR